MTAKWINTSDTAELSESSGIQQVVNRKHQIGMINGMEHIPWDRLDFERSLGTFASLRVFEGA